MRRKRIILLISLILLLLVGVSAGLWLHGQQRQYALNRQLIAVLGNNDTKAAIALVNAGADANTRAKPTPMPSLPDLLRQLLHHSPPPVNDSPTAFMIACGATWYDAALIESPSPCPEVPQLVEAMLRHGAKINIKDFYGKTPLLWAVIDNRQNTVLMLLECGANIDVQDTFGLTALHYAAIDANVPILHLLLEHGSSVNVQDTGGRTALYYAVWGRAYSNIVRELLAHKADPNLAAKNGSTPLSVAQGRPALALLKQAGARK